MADNEKQEKLEKNALASLKSLEEHYEWCLEDANERTVYYSEKLEKTRELIKELED